MLQLATSLEVRAVVLDTSTHFIVMEAKEQWLNVVTGIPAALLAVHVQRMDVKKLVSSAEVEITLLLLWVTVCYTWFCTDSNHDYPL